MEFGQLRYFAETSDCITEEVFETLENFVSYKSTGMRVTVTEILGIFKRRIENEEEITLQIDEEESQKVLTLGSFGKIIQEFFGVEIYEDVFGTEVG